MIQEYQKMIMNKNAGIIGDLFDFLINECSIEQKDAIDYFLKSKVCAKLENKEYNYLIGKSGIELGLEILEEFNIQVDDYSTISFIRTPEYWCGWAISYFHHIKDTKYSKIFEFVKFDELLQMYPTLHEADITKFIEVLEEIKKNKPSNLKKIRLNYGCSQKELSELSGVSLRSIQMYEQKQKNINKAQIDAVCKLAKALGCNIEDILE